MITYKLRDWRPGEAIVSHELQMVLATELLDKIVEEMRQKHGERLLLVEIGTVTVRLSLVGTMEEMQREVTEEGTT